MEFWYTAFRYNSDCMWISPILCYASLVTKLSLSGRGQVIWAPGSLKFPGFLENHDMKVTRLPALVHIKSMKILITPSGIEPATFQLHYRVPHHPKVSNFNIPTTRFTEPTNLLK